MLHRRAGEGCLGLVLPLVSGGKGTLEAVFLSALWHGGGVVAIKAGGAEMAVADQAAQIPSGQVAQAVRTDNVSDFRNGSVTGDKMVTGVDVGAVVAGVQEGRRRNSHMHFLGACVPQQADDLSADAECQFDILHCFYNAGEVFSDY